MRIGVCLAVWLVAAPAAAAPGLQLDVQGVCDVGPALDRARELLGHDPFDPAARDLGRIRTSTTSDGVVAELTIETADGRLLGPRTLQAASCDRLVADLAVVIAMTVSALPEPAPALPPPPAVPPIPSPPAVPHAHPSRSRFAFDAIAGISADGIHHDSSHTSGDVALRARTSHVAVELAVELAVPTSLTLANGASVHASTAMFALRPCLPLGPISACAVAAAGWTSGEASGVLVSHPGTLPVLYSGAGVDYERALGGRFALRLRAETRVNLIGARFEINGMPVTSSARVEGWLGLDAIAHLP